VIRSTTQERPVITRFGFGIMAPNLNQKGRHVSTKACSKCGNEKELSNFYRNKGKKDGRTPECKECVKARVKKYRQDNSEAVKKRKKDYYERNKETVIASQREYRRNNGRYRTEYLRYLERVGKDQYRKECRERAARYRDRNREKTRAYSREYREKHLEYSRQRVREHHQRDEYKERRRQIYWENPEIERLRTSQYRASKLQATPSWADDSEMLGTYQQAARMSADEGVAYHVDHIVPLQSESFAACIASKT